MLCNIRRSFLSIIIYSIPEGFQRSISATYAGFREFGAQAGFVPCDSKLEDMVRGRSDAAFRDEEIVREKKGQYWGKLA